MENSLIKVERAVEAALRAYRAGKAVSEDAARLITAFSAFLDFAAQLDAFEGTDHTETAKILYCGVAGKGNQVYKAEKLNMDVRTLYRYRKRYAEMILYFYRGQGAPAAAARSTF